MDTMAGQLEELMREGKLRDALCLLDDAILRRETSELWNDWATIQYQLGDPKAAEHGYRRAIGVDASDRQATVNLGLLLLGQGSTQEAEHLLEMHRHTLTSEETAAIGAGNKSANSFNPLDQEELALNRLPRRPRLSIIMPSNRSGLAPCARIFDACSCSSEDVEIIVRDNSGDRDKRNMLSRISRENCRVLSVESCWGVENYLETFRLSQGEFVFCIADDDILPCASIPQLVDLIAQHSADMSITGITGDYVIEGQSWTRLFRYQGLDGATAPARVGAYLADIGANAINYSVVRRSIVSGVASFSRTLPLWFSFTDQLVAFMYLCSGKFLSVNRLLYHYDAFNWDPPERALQSDLQFIHRHGLDGSTLRLMWLISALEGSKIVLGKFPLLDIPQVDRELVAMQWTKVMFARFLQTVERTDPTALFDREAVALSNKWKKPAEFNLDSLLADLSEFMALSNKDAGDRYFEFWKS